MDQTLYRKPVRTTFITVLCVLTFIGSGYSLVSSIITMQLAGKFEQLNEQTVNKEIKSSGTEKGNEFAEKMIKDSKEMLKKENVIKLNIGNIVANLLTLAGAILMFKMNKRGFWLYLAGIIIWIGTPLALFGVNSVPGIISAVGQGIVGVLFVVMYAFNLKEMNPVPVETDLL